MEENKRWTEYYYRIRKGKIKDPQAFYKSLQKGYGVEHPERINGFSGLVFGTGSVYVSKMLLSYMEKPQFREFVYTSLQSFEKEEYGDISSGDIEVNGENRWLGNGDHVIGRYGYYYGGSYQGKHKFDEVIRIRTWEGDTWITFDSEPDFYILLNDSYEVQLEETGPEYNRSKMLEVMKLDGIDFLREYRKHPEYYKPLTCEQDMVYPEDGNTGDSFWNAGIFEENIPYFAVFKEGYLNVTVAEIGMNGDDAEFVFLPKLIKRGLVKEDHNHHRPRFPYIRSISEPEGGRFYRITIHLNEKELGQVIRWTGNGYPFEALNRLNDETEPLQPSGEI